MKYIGKIRGSELVVTGGVCVVCGPTFPGVVLDASDASQLQELVEERMKKRQHHRVNKVNKRTR